MDRTLHEQFHVDRAARESEIVAMLADRTLEDDRRVLCEFLGADAPLPQGPFELAALLGAPVVLFSGVYDAGRRYRLRFELFCDRVVLPRDDRPAALKAWCQRYADWLAANCRAAPYNWFNFYDFWAS